LYAGTHEKILSSLRLKIDPSGRTEHQADFIDSLPWENFKHDAIESN
jgi:hypothetical protein